MDSIDFLGHNRAAWNRLAGQGDRLAKPATDADLADPLGRMDAAGWLGGDVRGKHILCLAAGGGRQGPIYAMAGAVVTVVDLSSAMLEMDRRVAAERKLDLRTVEASMDRLEMFAGGAFDIVIHPVSTCYVPQVAPVFCEVARVLKAGGLYISQHKQPTSLQTSLKPDERTGQYCLERSYYQTEPLPAPRERSLVREDGTMEWIHRWEDLIGGICRAGLVIEALSEPCHGKPEAEIGTFAHRGQFVAPYVRIKARKVGSGGRESGAGMIAISGWS